MKKLLLLSTQTDEPYLSYLKEVISSFHELKVSKSLMNPSTLFEVVASVKRLRLDGVLTTNLSILQKLVGVKISTSEASISNYAGSYFTYGEVPFVILNPLAQLITTPSGKFLAKRFISKLASPKDWAKVPNFEWIIVNPSNVQELYACFASARLIAIDIETKQTPFPHMDCIGFTAVMNNNKAISLVFPTVDSWSLGWIRKFTMLAAPKVFQNGKYDLAYLMRYNIIVYNYLFDTVNLFHSWYSELPKDLGFLQSFFIREAAYWKDLAKSSDRETRLLYNAKDTYATALACIAIINEIPKYAIHNYLNEFPLVFPCIMSELTGIPRDMKALAEAKQAQEQIIKQSELSLNTMLGVKEFNSSSPKQKKALLKILGCGDIAAKSTDEKSLLKASAKHPLNARILGQITIIQKAKKLLSTYLTEGKEFNGVILYSLSPSGTDTSRLASKEHHFWCGVNIQNIPRGNSLPKQSLVPYQDFVLAECDFEQAESRCTAYVSGEKNLIAAVSGEQDFHALNASKFFGVSYEEIMGTSEGKIKRELGKKINHGCSYLMGANVLTETMGDKLIFQAAKLLKLPAFWTSIQIAEHLIKQFHLAFPGLESRYYPSIVAEVVKTQKLQSKAKFLLSSKFTCDDWNLKEQEKVNGLTRYCFDNPLKDKRAKNALVAHTSQSLNAMILNKAFMLVFYNIAMNPKYSNNFKLIAQVHDSILFMFREGHEEIIKLVKYYMEIPIEVISYDGHKQTFTIPSAIKAGKDNKGARNWGEI